MLGSLFRAFAGKALKLPPRTSQIRVEKNVEMRTRDGVVLIADRYFPADGKPRVTVLTRSPYGRGFLMGFSAALLAERGLNVVVQSVRATDGSGGTFDPVNQERNDGADAARWIHEQPWFGGKLYLFGGSYLGWTAWAIATECPELVDGIALSMSHSNFHDAIREGGGLTLFTTLTWTRQMHDSITANKSPFFGGKAIEPAKFEHLPLGTIDLATMGATKSWWQDWVSRDSWNDPWWSGMDFSAGVTGAKAPTLLVAGWQDCFLPYQLDDLIARQAAGLPTWITIGPWEHGGPGGLFEGQRQAIEFLTRLAQDGSGPIERAPVKLMVQGAAQEWREYPSWPPPHVTPMQFHLRDGGGLDSVPEEKTESGSSYTYDPADPTPAIYGPVTTPGKSRDLSPYDVRGDVASFTTTPLTADLEVIGPVSVDLTIRASSADVDFYVALCEVDEQGMALHVCDGYLRLGADAEPAPDGSRAVHITCWPTAWRFTAGRKLRLYIASACFPRYARNLGTGEPMATGTRMVSTRVEILHGAGQGAAINLCRSA
jgi:putative CocE/NonD family hydrolase